MAQVDHLIELDRERLLVEERTAAAQRRLIVQQAIELRPIPQPLLEGVARHGIPQRPRNLVVRERIADDPAVDDCASIADRRPDRTAPAGRAGRCRRPFPTARRRYSAGSKRREKSPFWNSGVGRVRNAVESWFSSCVFSKVTKKKLRSFPLYSPGSVTGPPRASAQFCSARVGLGWPVALLTKLRASSASSWR